MAALRHGGLIVSRSSLRMAAGPAGDRDLETWGPHELMQPTAAQALGRSVPALLQWRYEVTAGSGGGAADPVLHSPLCPSGAAWSPQDCRWADGQTRCCLPELLWAGLAIPIGEQPEAQLREVPGLRQGHCGGFSCPCGLSPVPGRAVAQQAPCAGVRQRCPAGSGKRELFWRGDVGLCQLCVPGPAQ